MLEHVTAQPIFFLKRLCHENFSSKIELKADKIHSFNSKKYSETEEIFRLFGATRQNSYKEEYLDNSKFKQLFNVTVLSVIHIL